MVEDKPQLFPWDDDLDQPAVISVIGIGRLGATQVEFLKRNLPGVDCYVIESASGKREPSNFPQVLSAIRKSDLIFTLSNSNKLQNLKSLLTIGRIAREVQVPSIGIFPEPEKQHPNSLEFITDASEVFDCTFTTSVKAVTTENYVLEIPDSKRSFDRYAMRNIVSLISDLILRDSSICVDYADVKVVLEAGKKGKMGTGVATGDDKGATAATLALNRLTEQGVVLSEARGVLASVYGSPLLTMDEFNQVSVAMQKQFSEDSAVIIGLLYEEAMGQSLKVSVLALT